MKENKTKILSLDVKDQKILAELFKNGRAHYSTIAKNTHTSKDVVKYRIQKLVESGVMTNVSAIVDIRKLGWSSSLVSFKIMNLNKTKIKQFINYLVQNPFVVEILELAGGWDFAARFYHKDTRHLNQLLSSLETKFMGLINNYSIFFISENISLPYNALFEDYAFEPKTITPRQYEPDDLDLKILSTLSYHGRTPLAELQEKLKENRMTIYNRINKMVRADIITGFRPNLFTEHLGIYWYSINLKLNNRSDENIKNIVNKLKKIYQVDWIMTGFGLADIIFYIQTKTLQELQSILYMIREQFSANIKSIETATVKGLQMGFFSRRIFGSF